MRRRQNPSLRQDPRGKPSPSDSFPHLPGDMASSHRGGPRGSGSAPVQSGRPGRAAEEAWSVQLRRPIPTGGGSRRVDRRDRRSPLGCGAPPISRPVVGRPCTGSTSPGRSAALPGSRTAPVSPASRAWVLPAGAPTAVSRSPLGVKRPARASLRDRARDSACPRPQPSAPGIRIRILGRWPKIGPAL